MCVWLCVWGGGSESHGQARLPWLPKSPHTLGLTWQTACVRLPRTWGGAACLQRSGPHQALVFKYKLAGVPDESLVSATVQYG